WLYAIQGSLMIARKKGASWALTGGDTEHNLILEHLAYWNSIPANIGFYFDGPKVPDEKRGKRVHTRPHGLIHVFKELINGFNFRVVEAPGEAEAELAYLNRTNVLQHIVTPDVDAFLFGATSVIRSPRDSKNRDSVEVYTRQSLDKQDPDRLSRAGILFIAVVSGGDYSP
ncbi:PIN domain-like protein, partial [Coprinellus micaceus]